ncbi:MAG: hypothetical protein WB683_05105 [Candidatus Sulfotelmatobacter sp.]
MATPQQTSALNTLPADFFSAGGASAPDTLPANFFSRQAKAQAAPATLPADFFSKQAAPALPADFFSPQPARDPNARFFSPGGGQAEIRPYQPTLWDRIRNVVTAGIPNYSSRTVYNPKYGQMQLVSPEEAMTPSEQQAHPFRTGLGEMAGGLTSPESVALLAGTGGLGELPGAAAMLPRLMSAGFGAQAIYGGIKNVPAIRDAWNRGDVSEVERLLTHTVLNLGMGALAGQHAVAGESAITGRTAPTEAETPRAARTETPTPRAETRVPETTAPRAEARVPDSSTAQGVSAHNQAFELAKKELGPKADPRALLRRAQEILTESATPVSEVLNEVPRTVRVVDSSAAAHDLVEKDTVLRPITSLKGYEVKDPTLAPLEAQIRGRAEEVAQKYPVNPGEPEGTEARVTAPSGVAAFRNPTARVVNDGHVPVVSNDEILAQAVQSIVNNSGELRRVGVDPATIQTRGDIQSALQIASDHIASNLDPRASAVITLEGQKQLAADLGMTTEELLSRRQGQAFNAEELIAARALLKASNDSVISRAKAAAANGDTDSLNAFTTSLSQHKAIEETIAGVRAESGRALGSFRIGEQDLPQTKVADILAKLPQKAQAEAARLISRLDPTDPATVRKLNQLVEQVTPRTTLEKLHEYYRNALLSSPHTLVVKTASEASMAAMEAMKKVVASGISKDRYLAESWYYAKGMAQALAEHAKPILSGEFQLEGSPGFERAGQQAIKGQLGSIIRSPQEAMSRMTNLLYAGNYFGEVNSLAARQAIAEGLQGDSFHARQEYLAHHPTDEMNEAAHKLALRNTFQSELGKLGKAVGNVIALKPTAAWLPESLKSVAPGRWLAPFFKTPVNLFKAAVTTATPYELLNGFVKGDPDALARGVLGSSISAALAYLALTGGITGGGPTDYRKEETLRATGWQPYSIKIGNKYYSYHRFEPVGLAAGMIADAVHGVQHGDSEAVTETKVSSAVKHVARNLDDFPFMGTMANLLQAVHDPVGGPARSFINREAGSLIPAAVANVAESLDRTIRRPQNALQAIESRVPGLTQAAPPIVDVTGHLVQRPASNLGGGNPFPWTVSKHDPVVNELARLGISTPQPPAQIKWRGKKTDLTDAERQQFAMGEGQELYKRVGRLLQSGAWQRRSDDQKRKALVELHRMIDESRPARLTRMRRQSQADRNE